MVIEDKFIFLNIPRCASTSFHISCVNAGFDIKYNAKSNIFHKVKKFDKNDIVHIHEPLNNLISKFGEHYPIISIKRNKYERFLSMWRHVVSETKKYGEKNITNLFTNLTITDILCYESQDLLTSKSRHNFIINFLSKFDLNHMNIDPRVLTMLNVLITPINYYHNDNPNIKWFDLENLVEIEEWVKNITRKDFKLLNLNSSKDVEINIRNNKDFKERYDMVYGVFESKKNHKTII